MAVRDRSHDRADGQAVEIVIDKDQAAQYGRCELRASSGFDVRLRPAAECGGAAGLVHHGDDRPENDQEDQDTDVVGVRDGSNDAVRKDRIQRHLEVSVCREDRAEHDSNEQGGINFLRDQRQDDRYQRRDQRPERVVIMRRIRDGIRERFTLLGHCRNRDAQDRKNRQDQQRKGSPSLFHYSHTLSSVFSALLCQRFTSIKYITYYLQLPVQSQP